MQGPIAIHGLGYVGLTAAIHYARAGYQVVGYDPDISTIERLEAGAPRAGEFLSYLNTDVAELVKSGLIAPTSDFEATLRCPIHSIAVPTEKNGEPYSDLVTSIVVALAGYDSVKLIMIESTLAPGTTDSIITELPDDRSSPLIAVCPRRDWFADREKNLQTLTRVVGGVTPEATELAVTVLSHVSADIRKTDYRTAELVKALENSLLHVPVMLAHELAMNMPGHNVAEALELACTHWRLMKLHLGFGTGGRCVPLGTKYLQQASGPGGLLDAALTTDRHIRCAVAQAVAERGAKTALVLGIAYRPEFRDAGLSPGLAVAQYLRRDFGIDVTVHDPMWSDQELRNLTGFDVHAAGLEPEHLEPFDRYDAILLATPHQRYADLPTHGHIWRPGQFVLDGQGTWQRYAEQFARMRVGYRRVGESGWRRWS